MPQQIFTLLYLVFFLGTSISAMFIVYHITRYSLSRSSAFWGNTIFLSVLALLLLINVNLFSEVDWMHITTITPVQIQYTPTW